MVNPAGVWGPINPACVPPPPPPGKPRAPRYLLLGPVPCWPGPGIPINEGPTFYLGAILFRDFIINGPASGYPWSGIRLSVVHLATSLPDIEVNRGRDSIIRCSVNKQFSLRLFFFIINIVLG